MDVDNELPDNHTGDVDLEQSLIQQFNCLGTTDKDELVKQLQKLLGSQLNETAASFFLDMNNWNLQAAICSFFDIESPPNKLPSMQLLESPGMYEVKTIEPNTTFQRSYQVCNNGSDTWPNGCIFQFAGGDNLAKVTHIPVRSLAPGENTIISLDLTSPSSAGTYQSKYRMCTSIGSYFGDPVWCIVTVEEGTAALSEQLSHLSELGSSPSLSIPVNPFASNRSPTSQQNDTEPQAEWDLHMC